MQNHTMSKAEVHNWHTKVWLEEVDDVFNSVQFKLV